MAPGLNRSLSLVVLSVLVSLWQIDAFRQRVQSNNALRSSNSMTSARSLLRKGGHRIDFTSSSSSVSSSVSHTSSEINANEGSPKHLYMLKTLLHVPLIFAAPSIAYASSAQEALDLLHGYNPRTPDEFVWVYLVVAVSIVNFEIYKFLARL